MNGGIVTECPECETRFNVSNGQLKLADGKVRCGACLRVFDARAHQPYSETLRRLPETGSGNTPPQRPAPQEYSLHVRYAKAPRVSTAADARRPTDAANLLNRADDTAAFEPDAPLEVSSPTDTAQEQQRSNWRRAVPETPSAPIPIASFLRAPAQDARSEERSEDPFDQPPEQTPEQTPVTQPDAQDRAASESSPQTVAEPVSDPIAAEEPAYDHDGPAAHTALTEPEPRAESSSEPEPEPAVELASAAPTPAHSSQEQPASHNALPEPAAATATETNSPPAATEQAVQAAPTAQPIQQPAQQPQPQGLAALQDLHAEPLELTHPVAPAAPGAVLGWSLGCLAACVLLASQLAWFNRIEWSREPLLAGFYDILCHQVECAIPPYQVVELIHNRQLVVRAHPRFEDALSIDLLLENTANFRQPFPAIELSFSDIRGRTVARRVLQPLDYLDEALDPLKMPNSQPFQVNLAILDPGRRAVSYEVQLAPARL